MRILVIEDDAGVASFITGGLREAGHTVDHSTDGKDGLFLATTGDYDALVIDRMLPSVDGLTIVRTLRASEITTPVLILSARGDDIDKLRGFRTGCDDYVTKPFSLAELLARVDALARRGLASADRRRRATGESFAGLQLSAATREVRFKGSPIELRPREFDLLLALVRRGGAAVSRRDLLREVWGYSDEVESRTIDSHLVEVRRRLAEAGVDTVQILTVRKVGYRVLAESTAGDGISGSEP